MKHQHQGPRGLNSKRLFLFFLVFVLSSITLVRFWKESKVNKKTSEVLVNFGGDVAMASSSENSSPLSPSERERVEIFQQTVKGVVGVTNIQQVGDWFFGGESEIPAGTGSGFVWDTKGHIVTNFHVVHNGDTFTISFYGDPKQYKAKLVGVEPAKDIAVLKLEEFPEKLYPIPVGDSSQLVVGQDILAIGNPFQLNHSLTTGVVSALDRQIRGIAGLKINGMIQTDAAINPGNSGGPAIDSRGRLVGMNTQIVSSTQSSAGVGFAVPVNTIKDIVPQLIQFGKITRPVLGVRILEEEYIRRYFRIKEGAIIKYVLEAGPADKAGLRGIRQDRRGGIYLGDIILEIEGQKINSVEDIFQVLDSKKFGDELIVTYLRENQVKKTKITLFKVVE